MGDAKPEVIVAIAALIFFLKADHSMTQLSIKWSNMKPEQIIKEIKAAGNETIKKIHMKHGAKEPFYGVKVQDLKKIHNGMLLKNLWIMAEHLLVFTLPVFH